MKDTGWNTGIVPVCRCASGSSSTSGVDVFECGSSGGERRRASSSIGPPAPPDALRPRQYADARTRSCRHAAKPKRYIERKHFTRARVSVCGAHLERYHPSAYFYMSGNKINSDTKHPNQNHSNIPFQNWSRGIDFDTKCHRGRQIEYF